MFRNSSANLRLANKCFLIIIMFALFFIMIGCSEKNEGGSIATVIINVRTIGEGNPVGARVILAHSNGTDRPELRIPSNSNSVTFTDVDYGNYTLEIYHDDFAPVIETLSVFSSRFEYRATLVTEDTPRTRLNFINNTNQTINAIYLKDWDESDWGYNLLPSTLASGNTYTFTYYFEDYSYFDGQVRFVATNGNIYLKSLWFDGYYEDEISILVTNSDLIPSEYEEILNFDGDIRMYIYGEVWYGSWGEEKWWGGDIVIRGEIDYISLSINGISITLDGPEYDYDEWSYYWFDLPNLNIGDTYQFSITTSNGTYNRNLEVPQRAVFSSMPDINTFNPATPTTLNWSFLNNRNGRFQGVEMEVNYVYDWCDGCDHFSILPGNARSVTFPGCLNYHPSDINCIHYTNTNVNAHISVNILWWIGVDSGVDTHGDDYVLVSHKNERPDRRSSLRKMLRSGNKTIE